MQWCAPCDYNCPAINFAKPVYKWSIWNILRLVIFRSLLNQPSTTPNEFRLVAVTFFQIALYRRSLQDDCRATPLWLNLPQFSSWTISEKNVIYAVLYDLIIYIDNIAIFERIVSAEAIPTPASYLLGPILPNEPTFVSNILQKEYILVKTQQFGR